MTQATTETGMDLEGRDARRAELSPRDRAAPHAGTDGRRARERDGKASSRTRSVLRSLGIGLGLWQLFAPRHIARLVGVSNQRRNLVLIRALGVRKLAVGLGLLTVRKRPSRWLWARAAGDILELGLLGNALRSRRSDRTRVTGALAALAGVSLLDAWSARQNQRVLAGSTARIPIRRSTTIARPPADVYRFWRDFKNLPKFMVHLESVETLDETRSYWRARGVGGKSFEWNAEIFEDRENELISWRTMGRGSQVAHAGVVRFVAAPGGRGTEIHIEATYDPPGGPLGRAFALAFGQELSQQIEGDLRRLKQVLEAGEVVESDASIHRGMHPARPSVAPRVRRHGGQS